VRGSGVAGVGRRSEGEGIMWVRHAHRTLLAQFRPRATRVRL
jgi:hypothetical protein